jgi:hypothetical protein
MAGVYNGWQSCQSIKFLAFHHPIPHVITDPYLCWPFKASFCIALLYNSSVDV